MVGVTHGGGYEFCFLFDLALGVLYWRIGAWSENLGDIQGIVGRLNSKERRYTDRKAARKMEIIAIAMKIIRMEMGAKDLH